MALKATTKTEAVNQMLRGIGASPVNNIDDNNNVDVKTAVALLDEVSREVQTHGWHWNTEIDVPLSRDADNHLPVPANAIQVDVEIEDRTADIDPVQRGLKLYDVKNRTFEFDEDLKARVVYLLEWTDLPEPARNAIAKLAAFRSQNSDADNIGNLKEQAAAAWAALVGYEASDGDYTIFDSPDVASALQRRQPLRH